MGGPYPESYYYRRVFTDAVRAIEVWPYNHHKGGGTYQTQARLAFVHSAWGQG